MVKFSIKLINNIISYYKNGRGKMSFFNKIKEKHDVFSLLIAFVAVILSQFPPLYEIFDKAKFDIKTSSYIDIYPNHLSGIHLSKKISITNTGEKKGRVKNIYFLIVDKEDNIHNISKVHLYSKNEKNNFQQDIVMEFTEINLDVLQNWSHVASFLPKNITLNRNYRMIMNTIAEEKTTWEKKMLKEGYDFNKYNPGKEHIYFKPSNESMIRLKRYVMNNLNWFKEGDFTLWEIYISDQSNIYKSYNFKLTNHMIFNFKNGINYNDMFSIPIRINLIKKEATFKDKYLHEIQKSKL